MKVRVGYLEEPPFYSTGLDGSATGADIELAEVVLGAVGATSIEYVATVFGELLAGVDAGHWDMNVPIFVTPERSRLVAFSRPVWALVDGFTVNRGNPKRLTSYLSVAERADARLGVIPGQVQAAAARAAGVADRQLLTFANQPAAVLALLSGEIDAFAATALGNRAIVAAHPELEDLTLPDDGSEVPVGAFSFRRSDRKLLDAVNAELRAYLGSDDHRGRMTKYGFGESEIDGALAGLD